MGLTIIIPWEQVNPDMSFALEQRPTNLPLCLEIHLACAGKNRAEARLIFPLTDCKEGV